MVITGPAVFVMELTMERWRRRLARLVGRSTQSAADEADWETAVLPSSLALFDAAGHVARTAPVAARDLGAGEDAAAMPGPPIDPLSVNERKARAAAVRALMQARDGRFDQARDLFAEAATLDPALDLSTVPSFWNLPRHGQQAAVEGYEVAGREDDAVVLASELAYTFRPKLVRRQPVDAAPASGD
ncbi:MAG: hypothetical protein ACRDJH_17320 [Thermomicrobiales bacterium]